MSSSKMTVDQFRKLQSELAAEEMKLTIMKQMRQSQKSQQRPAHGYSSSRNDPGHPPSLQRSRDALHPKSSASPSSSGRSYSSPSASSSHYRAPHSAPRASEGSPGPVYHHSSSPHHQHHHPYAEQRMDYQQLYPSNVAPSERASSRPNGNGLPPPPPLRQLGRSQEADKSPARSATPGRDSPPSLMPRSQLEKERQAFSSTHQRTATPPLHADGRGSSAAAFAHGRAPSQARGRHSPSVQTLPPSAGSSPREYVGSQAHYRQGSSASHSSSVASATGAQQDQPMTPEVMLHKVTYRLNQLYTEREHYLKVYVPNKPPQYSWSLVPAPSAAMLALLGMDECVRRVQSDHTGVPLPDPERVTVSNRPHCAHCKSDFARFWRSFEEDGQMVIVCEDCDWARVKRPFVQQHSARLKECIPKADLLTEEMELLQRTAGVSVVPANRLQTR